MKKLEIALEVLFEAHDRKDDRMYYREQVFRVLRETEVPERALAARERLIAKWLDGDDEITDYIALAEALKDPPRFYVFSDYGSGSNDYVGLMGADRIKDYPKMHPQWVELYLIGDMDELELVARWSFSMHAWTFHNNAPAELVKVLEEK